MRKGTKLESLAELFMKSFPMGWIDNYDWNGAASNSLIAVKKKQLEFEDNAFYLFAQTVLSGEFHIRSNYSDVLDSLLELLSSGELYDDESIPLRNVAVLSFNTMTYKLCEVIKNYRHFLTTLIYKYKARQPKYIVNAYRVNHEIEASDQYIRLYNILIDVTRIDHFLSYGKKTIDSLILYHSTLDKWLEDKKQNENVLQVISILDKKCLFLLKKLLIDDNKEFDYMIDFRPHHYDTSKMELDYLSEMDKRFEFYRAESYSNDVTGNDLDIKARNNALSIGQYTLLMKYYKDSKDTSLNQINNILKDFNKQYNILVKLLVKRPLDKYALATLKNYMYNCRFSFLIGRHTYTFAQLQEDLNEIADIQCQTGILNFYPYRKAFEKALSLFRNNKNLKEEELMAYKEFLQQCISKFSEAMRWSRENCFYPIQNTYKECLVPVIGFGAVFVASSFCRPVRYEKLIDELNSFKNQALLIDSEIALREEKEEMQRLKNDVDKSRTREIEILSVFTAIVTFLFGTIGFFADNKSNDFVHLLFSVFGLGAILLIFVSGIHLITMRREKTVGDYFKHPRAWFCITTFFLCVVLLVWLVVKVNRLAMI